MVSTRNSMGETSSSKRKFSRNHPKPIKDKKDKLIKKTFKKVYNKLINNPDEQLKRKVLENLENLGNVIDGKDVEDVSKSSDSRKRKISTNEKKNSPKRIQPIISDSSDYDSDGNSTNLYNQLFNLREFHIRVKKLSQLKIAELVENMEKPNSHGEIEVCIDQPEEVNNKKAEVFETQPEEIIDQVQDGNRNKQSEQVKQPEQIDFNIDENSSSNDVLIQEADIAKKPQTEPIEVIELDDDNDDDDGRPTEINAQVSDLIKDLTSELPQNSTLIEPQRKFIDPNEVIVIDDEDDIEESHQEKKSPPVNTSTVQKPSRILVINGQKLKELLESGDDIQTICSKLGLQSVKNDKSIPVTSENPETEISQQLEPEIANISENPPTNEENTIPGNITSSMNSKSTEENVNEASTSEIITPETPSVVENPHIVDSDSNSSSLIETEVTSNDIPAETKNSTPHKRNLVFKIMKTGSPSNKSYIMKPSNVKSSLTSQKGSTNSAAVSILKENQKTNSAQETRNEDQMNVPDPIKEVRASANQPEENRVVVTSPSPSLSPSPSPSSSTSTNQVQSTTNLETEASSTNTTDPQRVKNSSRKKPIRRESLLRVKSFANESLMPNFKFNVSSTSKSSASKSNITNSTQEVDLNSSSNRNQNSMFIEELKEKPENSKPKILADMRHRSRLKPWIKDSKPEPYYEMKKALLSCLSLHSDYKCMNSKCAFYTSSAELFDKHLRQHLFNDPLNTILECPYCKFYTPKISSLIQHIDMYHEYDRFMCPYCFYRALDLSNVVLHMKLYHHNASKSIFELENKKKIGKINPSLTHEAMKQNVPPLKCLFCVKKFMTFEMFMNHIEFHTGTYDFTLTCSICKSPIGKQDLVQHLKSCYGFGIYQCISCKFGTDDVNRMREHLANEHPSNSIMMAQRKYKQGLITDYSDPSFLSLAKAPVKIDPLYTQTFKYQKEMLLNEKNVSKIDYTEQNFQSWYNSSSSRDVVNARRTTTNFDQSIPCAIIERPNANSTVIQTIPTSVDGISSDAFHYQQSPSNIRTSVPMVFIPFIQSMPQNYVYSTQQQLPQTQPPILLNGTHVNSIIRNPNLLNELNSNPTSTSYNTAPEQIVVPKISNVFSFQNVP